jgi:hypothetical protein
MLLQIRCLYKCRSCVYDIRCEFEAHSWLTLQRPWRYSEYLSDPRPPKLQNNLWTILVDSERYALALVRYRESEDEGVRFAILSLDICL